MEHVLCDQSFAKKLLVEQNECLKLILKSIYDKENVHEDLMVILAEKSEGIARHKKSISAEDAYILAENNTMVTQLLEEINIINENKSASKCGEN